MSKLENVTNEFLSVLASPVASDDEVNVQLQECFALLPDSTADEIGTFMAKLSGAFALPDVNRGGIAATVCGYLVERGFPSEGIIDKFIAFYGGLLDTSRPFFEMFLSQVQIVPDDDEERDHLVEAIYQELLGDRDIVSPEMFRSVVALDSFYACAVSLFSINRQNFFLAKEQFADKVAFRQRYNQGCYWINKLFSVLFDEPVTVIDIDRHIGFEGTISGIVDNYQLQHLLMATPLLNGGVSLISDEHLAVINGNSDTQITEDSIESKWNLYNLELCSQTGWKSLIDTDKPQQSVEYRDTWIWSEGAPADISVHGGRRVVLLGTAAYSRSARVQRTFRNLKAAIVVEKELSADEINEWLGMK